ncbi:hypothetical protein [Desulfocicer vacuolatum]|nr:hypothetical protein [Desulfocicer vacuolatum]
MKHKGPVKPDGFIQPFMDIATHPQYLPNMNILFDYRLADISNLLLKEITAFHNYLMDQHQRWYNRISIVVDNGVFQDKICPLPFKEFSQKEKIFQSIFQGEAWLFKNTQPQIKASYQSMNQHMEKIRNLHDHHVMYKDGTILSSTVKMPLDNIPLRGRKISEFLHDAYAYPFMCLLRRVTKAQKKAWINFRIHHQDYAHCIIPIDSTKAHVTEFNISGMGEYEVERLKWYYAAQ